jgi:hypothetical protein
MEGLSFTPWLSYPQAKKSLHPLNRRLADMVAKNLVHARDRNHSFQIAANHFTNFGILTQ